MGKYMRKAKITSDVAVMDLSHSSLGVRTRAKTLALKTLQSANSDSSCYLQLRNRRLEKINDSVKQPPDGTSRLMHVNTASVGSDSICCSKNENDCFVESARIEEDAEGYENLGVEASFGENNLDFEARERSTRESTPCSLIRGSDSIENPGSSTRPTNLAASDRRTRNSMQQDIATTREMEEFFAFTEQQQQKLFTEKYNFDVVNDLPLPGRYEWVRV